MHVILKNMWFAPTEVWKKDKIQSMSGKRYREGEYTDMPDYLYDYLPKSATVIKKPKGVGAVEEKSVKEVNALHEHDEDRAVGLSFLEIAEQEEKEAKMKERRREILAKAREAKAKKKANREAQEAAMEALEPGQSVEITQYTLTE